MLATEIKAFIQAETGATSIEYTMLAVLIAVVVVGAFAALGNNLVNLFDNGIANAIEARLE
ncbi:MAG: Flp family type IVb pilin [Candidatus Devosia euplotis]|nr:Flp family type IVb pilin [Candidatus Devosia euplotis]